MYDLVSEHQGQAVGITVKGKLSRRETAELTAYLQEQLERHDAVQVLFDVSEVPPADVEAVAEVLGADVADRARVLRVAVVGDAVWERWSARLRARFPGAVVQFYGPAHVAEAWSWIRHT